MANQKEVVIIGAGPAGLTAGYILSKSHVPVAVLEQDPQYVGGISRTARYKGYHFDIGGHRFFSKSKEVEDLWTEILPNDLLVRPRSSRIFYKGRFFAYPLKATEALFKLGVLESTRCVASYVAAQVKPVKNPRSFEDWVSNEFGRRLFEIFFKTYTEKVWGMSCREISADWAAQRIKGLSLTTAVMNAILPKKKPAHSQKVVKTLIESFRYPRRGPGMMWEACATHITSLGGEVRMGARVCGCRYDRSAGTWTVEYGDEADQAHAIQARHVISSAPVRELVNNITPAMSEESRAAASALRYRDHVSVVLIAKDRARLEDNWIYIHDPGVRVGRVQNFKSWSPEMVPDPSMACYGLEYFCTENDDFWNASDADLIALGRRELATIGLARSEDILDGCVVRQKKAYPVYDDHYAERMETIRREIEADYPTLHLVGRNGMHKYNNQDHAMMTAMLTARNILAGERIFDVWRVNQDAEYHESGSAGESSGASGLRAVPRRIENASRT